MPKISNSKKPGLAIALVSGGMDSLVCAAIAQTQWQKTAFLHLNYGQKTNQKELQCFHAIARHYNIPDPLKKVVDAGFLGLIGGSSLTDKKIPVKKHIENQNQIPDSYVPFRNTHIIALAVSWAEVINAKRIYIGAVHEDSSGYPDCRPSYYKAINNLIKEGTKEGDIQVETPIIHYKKQDIVKAALELQAPLELTWSCYDNSDLACGVCDSCVLRLKGFHLADASDPLAYSK
ncbi:MAG: 7-cyano-7-deazaguanine synthase QueC [Halobacteriovoraceae bacterium]|nr:7-cyano-7-deazaguanine synthase QueC [Halobacteriovoraceae bacterium]